MKPFPYAAVVIFLFLGFLLFAMLGCDSEAARVANLKRDREVEYAKCQLTCPKPTRPALVPTMESAFACACLPPTDLENALKDAAKATEASDAGAKSMKAAAK